MVEMRRGRAWAMRRLRVWVRPHRSVSAWTRMIHQYSKSTKYCNSCKIRESGDVEGDGYQREMKSKARLRASLLGRFAVYGFRFLTVRPRLPLTNTPLRNHHNPAVGYWNFQA